MKTYAGVSTIDEHVLGGHGGQLEFKMLPDWHEERTMDADGVTIVVDDEERMHYAADCALQWLMRQPEHVAGTSYGFIVDTAPDGRVTLAGVPWGALHYIRSAGIAFELFQLH